MSNLSLGQKIKKYRLRSGKSQLDLELETGLSTGTLSRIENGVINPTKETIIAISKALELTDEQIASLFSLNVYNTLELLKVINKFSEELDSDKSIQIAIDEISDKMNFRNVSILLLDETILRGYLMNHNKNSSNAMSMVNVPFNQLIVEPPTSKSILLKSALEGKVFQSNRIFEFGHSAVPEELADKMQKMTKINTAIVLPLEFRGTKLGCIFFAKEETESYESELPLIWAFTRQIAIEIYKNNLIKNLKIVL